MRGEERVYFRKVSNTHLREAGVVKLVFIPIVLHCTVLILCFPHAPLSGKMVAGGPLGMKGTDYD